MSKNLISEIAKLLGVEIGEEFKIKNDRLAISRSVCRFTDKMLEGRDPDRENWETLETDGMFKLLSGEYEIVKLPYKPKVGEKYFSYFGTEFIIVDCNWQGFASQYSLLKNGCIFRTEAEAIKERPRIYKALTGKDWSE